MPTYCLMLLATVAFALAAVYYPQSIRVRLNHSGSLLRLKPSHLLMFLSFLPLFLVSALRYKVGVDYLSYTYIFQDINAGKASHTEAGYELLNRLVGAYTADAQWIYALSAAISLALIVWGIYRYSVNPAYSLFLFVTMGYLFSSFNILRQYVAIALIFAALQLVREKRFLPFCIVVLLAATFHKTAIIMIPLYFLLRLRLKQSYMLMITMVGMGCIPLRGVLTNLLVNTFYPQYAGTDLIQPLSTFEFIYYALVFGLLVLLCFRYKGRFFQNTYNLILFNCVFYSFLIYLCLSFVPEINRIAVYMEFFVILLIPRLFACEENPKVRRLYYVLSTLFFLAFFFLSVGVMGRYNVVPYSTVFSRP